MKVIETFKNLFFGAPFEKNKTFVRVCGCLVLGVIAYFAITTIIYLIGG